MRASAPAVGDRIILRSGRTYVVVNASRKPGCVGTLRLVESGDSANASALVYHPPPPPDNPLPED